MNYFKAMFCVISNFAYDTGDSCDKNNFSILFKIFCFRYMKIQSPCRLDIEHSIDFIPTVIIVDSSAQFLNLFLVLNFSRNVVFLSLTLVRRERR